jgi:pullulanase/glycogen debranching enzyme
MLSNAYSEDLIFTIQEDRAGEWHRVVDTSLASLEDNTETGKGHPISSLKARSIVVLLQ